MEKSTVRIVVVRHPEKDGDAITALGAMQAFAMAIMLGTRFTFERLVSSGANRTWQTVRLMAAALGLDIPFEVNTGFLFEATLTEVFGQGNNKRALDEIAPIKEAGGTIAVALQMSAYARLARERVTASIIALAADMIAAGQSTALVISHSPWMETAGDPATTPYSLGEADAIVFTVEDGVIIGTEFVGAALPGKSK